VEPQLNTLSAILLKHVGKWQVRSSDGRGPI